MLLAKFFLSLFFGLWQNNPIHKPNLKIVSKMADNVNNMTREDFMNFFRDDEKLSSLSADDRIEIFLQILPGNSDITEDLLKELISDYQVDNLKVCQVK